MKFNMDTLRDIGWTHWDPIDLRRHDRDWRSMSCRDEYDSYLVRAARRCLAGQSVGEVAAYLIGAATHRIGLGGGPHTVRTSVTTARHIMRYVEDYRAAQPTGPDKVKRPRKGGR